MADAQWVSFQNPAGLVLQHPAGWMVHTLPSAAVIVSTPDHQSFVLMQPLGQLGGMSGAQVISEGRFATAGLFPMAKAGPITPGPNNSITTELTFAGAQGVPSRVRMNCFTSGDTGMIFAYAATEDTFRLMEPALQQIINSIRMNGPQPVATVSAGSPHVPVAYTRFTDPQAGTFTMDVPVGWQVRGGFVHAGLGDRRPWVEAGSSDGIYLLAGDPGFPQGFCHYRGQPEGVPTQLAGGGVMLNLKPSPEIVADQYIRQIVSRRFGQLKLGPRRARPDVVQILQTALRKMMTIPRGFLIAAIETPFTGNKNGLPLVGSLISTCLFNGQYGMGAWAFWDGGTSLAIFPPSLAGHADEVRLHMMASYQNSPRMFQIAQQDETMIMNNSAAANAQQWNWFAGQQQAHNAQVAAGDAMVDNYWQQQASNDSMIRGWEHNQAVNDRLSDDRSDAMLDRQRLSDDAMGKSYEVPAGFNHYWLDQQSGQVVGTNTSDPPDLTNNYTQLRKM